MAPLGALSKAVSEITYINITRFYKHSQRFYGIHKLGNLPTD